MHFIQQSKRDKFGKATHPHPHHHPFHRYIITFILKYFTIKCWRLDSLTEVVSSRFY